MRQNERDYALEGMSSQDERGTKIMCQLVQGTSMRLTNQRPSVRNLFPPNAKGLETHRQQATEKAILHDSFCLFLKAKIVPSVLSSCDCISGGKERHPLERCS